MSSRKASRTTPIARAVLGTLGRLPEPVLARLAPRPVIDGNQLHPEVAAGLRALNALPAPSVREVSVDQARQRIEDDAAVFGARVDLPRVMDLTLDVELDGRAWQLPGRRYEPHAGKAGTGLLLYFHGGGWVVGSLDSADSVCRVIAAESGVTVVSVDYRLAPEHPFPAAVEDAVAAYRWGVEHAHDLGHDPAKVLVGGDSAGGNLAAVVAAQVRDRRAGDPAWADVPAPLLQVLFYPVTDLSRESESHRTFADGYFLTLEQMRWYNETYLAGADPTDVRASPLLADDLTGLAPAYVGVAGFDPLRDEGIAYAERLMAAGVPTELFVERGQIHGYVNATGVGRTGRAAVSHASRAISRATRA